MAHGPTFCDKNEVMRYLVLLPYPHDSGCGCLLCAECKPGKSCSNCSGYWVVCLDIVQPGPIDIDSISTWIPQTEQQKANAAIHARSTASYHGNAGNAGNERETMDPIHMAS